MQKRQSMIILSLIIGGSFILKMLAVDYAVISDGQTYYNMSLAWATSNSFFMDRLIYLHNLGMPLLHGFIFKVIQPSIPLHVFLTIVYSCVALVFAYLFLRQFVSVKYALFGTFLLAFNFRLVQNAAFGITEPLFLMLIWGAFYFSVTRTRYSFLAIPLSILSILVRFEGIIVFGFVIWQFVSSKKYYYVIVSFVSLLPFYFTRMFDVKKVEDAQEKTKVLGIIETHVRHEITYVISIEFHSLMTKVSNGIVYFGWSLFPEFLMLVPLGIYGIIRKAVGKTLLFWIFVFVAVGIYAYMDAYDTRYFFMSFLFVDLLCIVGLRRFLQDVRVKSLMLSRADKK